MRKIVSVLIMLTFVFTACNSGDKTDDPKVKDEYQKNKESLGQTEKKNPKGFLTVEGSDKKNLLGQRVIKGIVTSKATVASFKDVDVELSFYSKTGALLEKDHEIVYETIAPGGNASFKTKYFAPKGTDSVAMKVVGAKTE